MATNIQASDTKLNTVAYQHYCGFEAIGFIYCPKCHKERKCRPGSCTRVAGSNEPLKCSECHATIKVRKS